MEKTQNKLNMRLESRKFPINLQDREFNLSTSQILPEKPLFMPVQSWHKKSQSLPTLSS